MKVMTAEQAKKKKCPFKDRSDKFEGAEKCEADGCMAWEVIVGPDRREDHSGNLERMGLQLLKTGHATLMEKIYKKNGNVILDAHGHCKAIHKDMS